MHVELKDFKTGWYGVLMKMQEKEIGTLITMLEKLRKREIGHFHFYSDYEAERGIGDIEVSMQGEQEPDNMFIDG